MSGRKYLYMALFILAVALPSAAVHKSAKQAEKLTQSFDKLPEARKKIAEALSDSLQTPDAYTYYVAGKIEETAVRHYNKLLGINRADPKVDRTVMADALLSSLDYYRKAMALDTTYDKKGNPTTKYSDRIADWINASHAAQYNAGVAYMNKRMYYPQAYTAFATYASAPSLPYYRPTGTAINDSLQANAWFYAGVMAYNAAKYEPASRAFEKARLLGHPKKEVLLNEMTCLSQMVRADSTLQDSMSVRITLLAQEGHQKFGLTTPLFLQKYVAGLLLTQHFDSALHVIDSAISTNPKSSMLHSMRAGVLRQTGNLSGASAEYRKAAESPDAEFTTLSEAAKTIAEEGLQLLSAIKSNTRTAREKKEKIRQDYLAVAKQFALRAQAMKPEDEDLQNTLLTIEYYLH